MRQAVVDLSLILQAKVLLRDDGSEEAKELSTLFNRSQDVMMKGLIRLLKGTPVA